MDVKQNRLPDYLKKYFWDVDFTRLSEKDSRFIINRLMDHGDEQAVQYLLNNFSRDQMTNIVKHSRSLSRRSRGFWKKYLGMGDVPCIPKRYPTPYGNYSRD